MPNNDYWAYLRESRESTLKHARKPLSEGGAPNGQTTMSNYIPVGKPRAAQIVNGKYVYSYSGKESDEGPSETVPRKLKMLNQQQSSSSAKAKLAMLDERQGGQAHPWMTEAKARQFEEERAKKAQTINPYTQLPLEYRLTDEEKYGVLGAKLRKLVKGVKSKASAIGAKIKEKFPTYLDKMKAGGQSLADRIKAARLKYFGGRFGKFKGGWG